MVDSLFDQLVVRVEQAGSLLVYPLLARAGQSNRASSRKTFTRDRNRALVDRELHRLGAVVSVVTGEEDVAVVGRDRRGR